MGADRDLAEQELNKGEQFDIFHSGLNKGDLASLSDFEIECNYFSERNFIDNYKNSKASLVLSINIQSLASKIDILSSI